MNSISPNLNLMIKACEKASKVIIRDFGELEKLQVSIKGQNDFVTMADIKAQEIIHYELSRARDNYGFLITDNNDIYWAIQHISKITITKGFQTWKEMVYEADGKLEEHGIKFIFAGTQKDDPTKLHVIMQFPSMDALEAFKGDEELTKKRIQAGAVVETMEMTPMSDDYLTNYPEPHIRH